MDDDIDPEAAADHARMTRRERWRYFHAATAWGAALGVLDLAVAVQATVTGRLRADGPVRRALSRRYHDALNRWPEDDHDWQRVEDRAHPVGRRVCERAEVNLPQWPDGDEPGRRWSPRTMTLTVEAQAPAVVYTGDTPSRADGKAWATVEVIAGRDCRINHGEWLVEGGVDAAVERGRAEAERWLRGLAAVGAEATASRRHDLLSTGAALYGDLSGVDLMTAEVEE